MTASKAGNYLLSFMNVTNTGKINASGITVYNPLAPQLNFKDYTYSLNGVNWVMNSNLTSWNNSTKTWNVGTLEAGQTKFFSIRSNILQNNTTIYETAEIMTCNPFDLFRHDNKVSISYIIP